MATPDEDTSFQPLTSQQLSEEDQAFQPVTGGPKTLQQGFGIPTIPGRQSTPTTFNNIWDKAIDFIRPFVGTGTGILAAIPAAAGSGPAAGIAGLGADVGGYTAADTVMQYLKVHQPENLQEAMSTASRDAVLNGVGGRIANGIVKGGMAFRSAGTPEIYKLFPTTSQALEHFGIKGLPAIAKAFEDIGAPGAKAAAQARSGGEAGIQALELSNIMNGKPPGSLTNADPQQLVDAIKARLKSGVNPSAQPNQFQTQLHHVSKDLLDDINGGKDPFQVLRDKLSNDKELEKFLSLGQTVGPSNMNVREDLQAFNFSDLFKRATTPMVPDAAGRVRARIDPKLFADEWFAPSRQATLTKLYGAQQKQTLDGFINRVLTTQDNPLVSPKVAYVGNGFTLGGGLATILSGHAIPAAAAIYVPIGTMSRLLTNTKVAKAISAFMGAEPVPQALSIGGKEQLGKTILDGLQGMRYAIVGPDGKKTWNSPLAKSKDSTNFTPANGQQ